MLKSGVGMRPPNELKNTMAPAFWASMPGNTMRVILIMVEMLTLMMLSSICSPNSLVARSKNSGNS